MWCFTQGGRWGYPKFLFLFFFSSFLGEGPTRRLGFAVPEVWARLYRG